MKHRAQISAEFNTDLLLFFILYFLLHVVFSIYQHELIEKRQMPTEREHLFYFALAMI